MSAKFKHIAIVCPALGGAGSVANVALRQARELARNFGVTLVSDGFPSAGFAGVDHFRLMPYRFNVLRRFAHVPNELAFVFAVRRALAKLHATKPISMVICHGHAVAALVARPLQRHCGVPYALVTHGDIFDRPKGTYDPRLTWFYRWVTPVAYRDANLVVALSPHMAMLAARGGAKQERISLIPNGVDPTDIGLGAANPPASRPETGKLELLYVGRLSVEKGVDVLIEAAAILRGGGVRFRLRIVGAGGEEHNLRYLAARHDLGNVIEFIGSVSRKGLGQLYQSADIVCVPSRSDPLPTVVLEAMAAEVAVVGANTGGIPFMVRHGETGLICEAGSATALAGALEQFELDTSLPNRMGKAGRERANAEFNWARIGGSLFAAIENSIHQTKKKL